MFGREMRLPLDVMIGETPPTSKSYGEFASILKSPLTDAYIGMLVNSLEPHNEGRRSTSTVELKEAAYEAGDLVLLVNPQLKVKEASKSHRNWKEPYGVKERVTEVTYRILKLGDPPSRSKIVHCNNLKLHQRKKEARTAVRPRRKRAPAATAKPDYHAGKVMEWRSNAGGNSRTWRM